MKKELSKLGLVGVLSLGLLGSSAYGLETNEKGFPVPDKTDAKLMQSSPFTFMGKVVGVVNEWDRPNGTGFNEYVINGKIASYRTYGPRIADEFRLLDNNCGGVFESKYGIEEFIEKKVPIPDCYFK